MPNANGIQFQYTYKKKLIKLVTISFTISIVVVVVVAVILCCRQEVARIYDVMSAKGQLNYIKLCSTK